MRKIAICDSSPEVLNRMQEMLNGQYGGELQVVIYPTNREMLGAWQKDERKKADIAIMELKENEEEGIGIARQVREIFGDVKIIFFTDSLESAEDIFDADPVYLLIKPVKQEKLFEAVDRALEQMEGRDAESVTLISKSFIARVKASSICYVESERRILTVHCREEDIRVNMKLSDLEGRLPEYFLRIHQSYLVNMKQIRFFSAKGVELYDGRIIPVSRPRYARTKEIFLQFLGEKEV